MTGPPPDQTSAAVPSEAPIPPPPAPLSPEARATAFATGRVPIDRAAALRSGTTPVPGKFIVWIVAGFAVLGLGGVLVEKLVGNAGATTVVTTPTTTLAGTSFAAPPTPVAPSAPPVGASAVAFIGLTPLAGQPAPPLSLQRADGTPWTLALAAGKVTIVAFVNAECNDICPVLAKEIAQADQLLGPRTSSVDFVVVNSDPLETSLTPPPALTQTGLSSLANVTFLNGPLPAFNRVWSGYGVTVAVDRTTRVVTHSDVMDFIDPTGRLKSSATPFANEDRLGIFSLPPDSIQKFAQGIAQTAESLFGRSIVTDETVEPPGPLDPFELEGIIAEAPLPPPWYKRVWVVVTAAVVIVVAASVIVDLPSHTSVSRDIADQTSIMHTINTDVGGCAFAVHETFTIYQDMKTGHLSTSDRSEAPTMLRDDQSACSFTNSDIFDLSNVETTGSPAGKSIAQVENVSTLWVTSDALAAIEDIQNLFGNSGSASSLADLTRQEAQLAKDRAQADGYVQAADRILGGARLPMPNLPSLPHLAGT